MVDAVGADFAEFLLPHGAFQLPFRYQSIGLPCTKSDQSGSYIALPHELAAREIGGTEELFGYLLMLGHEIAHLIHRHEFRANAQSVEEFRCLEIWADWYGAKVATALINGGPRTHALAGSPSFELFVDQMAAGVDFLVERVYREHEKYPSPLERAGLTANGVLSYLSAWLGYLKPDVYEGVILGILRVPHVAELVERQDVSGFLGDDDLFRAADWHRQMQNDNKALRLDFRDDVANLLHTNFDRSDDEIREARQRLLEQFRRDGFDV